MKCLCSQYFPLALYLCVYMSNTQSDVILDIRFCVLIFQLTRTFTHINHYLLQTWFVRAKYILDYDCNKLFLFGQFNFKFNMIINILVSSYIHFYLDSKFSSVSLHRNEITRLEVFRWILGCVEKLSLREVNYQIL